MCDLDRESEWRLPWHDIAMQVFGKPVQDMALHFNQVPFFYFHKNKYMFLLSSFFFFKLMKYWTFVSNQLATGKKILIAPHAPDEDENNSLLTRFSRAVQTKISHALHGDN
jgi:hypothetical protein